MMMSELAPQPGVSSPSRAAVLALAASALAGPDVISSDVLAGAVRLSGHSVLLRIGESDSAVNAARTFAARCPTATLEVVRGCHDDGFWRASADELVGFAAQGLFA